RLGRLLLGLTTLGQDVGGDGETEHAEFGVDDRDQDAGAVGHALDLDVDQVVALERALDLVVGEEATDHALASSGGRSTVSSAAAGGAGSATSTAGMPGPT